MINIEFLNSEACRLGINLDAKALKRFDLLAQRLVSWNKNLNLTAITEPD